MRHGYVAKLGRPELDRVVLLQREEGTYVLVFKTPHSHTPEEDHYQADLDMARMACEQDYGILPDMWVAVDEGHTEY